MEFILRTHVYTINNKFIMYSLSELNQKLKAKPHRDNLHV